MKVNNKVIGIDIGGSKIFAARFNEKLAIEKEVKIATGAKEGALKVVDNLISAIEQVKDDKVFAIGIAWAGFVDSKNGIIIHAPNVTGFDNYHLSKKLEEKTKLPVFIENDARLFTFAEQRLGICKGDKNVLGIIIGTGVGSGIIINNEIYSGSQGFAGEIGHTFVNLQNNNTDNKEIEDIFAAKGLNNLFNQSSQDVQSAIESGDLNKKKKFEPILNSLAKWLCGNLLAFNPDSIVFGGGIGSNFLPLFKDQIHEKLSSLIKQKHIPLKIKIRYSIMKNAGAVGAAIFAKEKITKILNS